MTTATLALTRRAVRIPAAAAMLEAEIVVPPQARGLVLFAQPIASCRHSPHNRGTAEVFNDVSIATMLPDLLTPEEERIDTMTREMRFDIALLADRLTCMIDWIAGEIDIGQLPLGIFGSGTGAAAALEAAARRPSTVHAVVSRGGRPDLADCLDLVRAPVLLIVGGSDSAVLDLNRQALHHLHGIRLLEIIPGATHMFEEHDAMERVTRLSRDWLRRYVLGDREDW
jgi:putative phosphoribosyl transferase